MLLLAIGDPADGAASMTARDLIAPGAACCWRCFPAMVLQAPLWVYYRRMDFVQQRLIQAVDPLRGVRRGGRDGARGRGLLVVRGRRAGRYVGARRWSPSGAARIALRFRYDRGDAAPLRVVLVAAVARGRARGS